MTAMRYTTASAIRMRRGQLDGMAGLLRAPEVWALARVYVGAILEVFRVRKTVDVRPSRFHAARPELGPVLTRRDVRAVGADRGFGHAASFPFATAQMAAQTCSLCCGLWSVIETEEAERPERWRTASKNAPYALWLDFRNFRK